MPRTEEIARGLFVWVRGQPFNNVLCLLQLSLMAFSVWYGMTTLVPEERRAITTFGEALEANHTKQVERITSTYEKMLDRVANGNKKPPQPDAAGALVEK